MTNKPKPVVPRVPTDFGLTIFSRRPEDVIVTPNRTVVTLRRPILTQK